MGSMQWIGWSMKDCRSALNFSFAIEPIDPFKACHAAMPGDSSSIWNNVARLRWARAVIEESDKDVDVAQE